MTCLDFTNLTKKKKNSCKSKTQPEETWKNAKNTCIKMQKQQSQPNDWCHFILQSKICYPIAASESIQQASIMVLSTCNYGIGPRERHGRGLLWPSNIVECGVWWYIAKTLRVINPHIPRLDLLQQICLHILSFFCLWFNRLIILPLQHFDYLPHAWPWIRIRVWAQQA